MTTNPAPAAADRTAGTRGTALLDPRPIETWTAHFTPEAWVNDYAVTVDAEGPQTWDCTEHALANRAYLADLLDHDTHHAADHTEAYTGLIDRDDAFQADPAAPTWVRDWRGPFTIRLVRRIDA